MNKRVKLFRTYSSDAPDTKKMTKEINSFVKSFASDIIDIKTSVEAITYTSSSYDYNHNKQTQYTNNYNLVCTLIYIPLEGMDY